MTARADADRSAERAFDCRHVVRLVREADVRGAETAPGLFP
jgi:hypothetical protein